MNLHGRIAMTLAAAGGEYHQGPLLLLSRHLECGETAASKERTASLFEMPGLDVWVQFSASRARLMRAAQLDNVHYATMVRSAGTAAATFWK